MKKTTSMMTRILITVLVLFSTTVPIFASTATETQNWKEKVTEYQERRQELAALRSSVHDKVVTIRTNRLENKVIWAQNQELRAGIKLELNELRESGVVLDENLKIQLKGLTEQLKTKYASLKETSGDIRELTVGIKELIKARDTEALDDIYAQVIDIQLVRSELLSEINALLSEISSLIP
ncbi:MAG TPA: hypothetical protein DCQ90_03360 [Erysipelotrichaceae bacterium]|nr:hypothetical protein [Erysipelotrichaceae bacterium]